MHQIASAFATIDYSAPYDDDEKMRSRRALFKAYNAVRQDDYFIHGISRNLIQRLWHILKYRKIFSLIDQKGSKLLDIGCGNGIFCHEAQTKGFDPVGVDISIPFLRRAKYQFGDLQLVLADAASLPFRNDAFDVVVSMETLEHLPDPQKTIHEIERVSRSFGICITFNQDDTNLLWKLSWFLWRRSEGLIWENLHLGEISPRMLSGLLSQERLIPEKMVREHFYRASRLELETYRREDSPMRYRRGERQIMDYFNW